MSISTLQPIQSRRRRPRYANILVYVSAILVALILVFFSRNIIDAVQSIGGKSAVTVDVSNGRADIFINDENVGAAPYESQDIKPGENKISVKSQDRIYETTIKFLSNNDKYIHKVGVFRDLGISDLFSSGQDLWFDEDTSGTVLRIISEPSGASVYIDNTEIGKTPFTSSKLTEGDYDLRVEHVGFEPQKARIRIQKGYISNISMKLFPMPVPSRVSPFEGSDGLYDLSSDNAMVVADTETWAKSIIYWNQTRGINLEGVGLNKELLFDYFVDYKGNIFDELGTLVSTPINAADFAEADRGGYLGRVADGEGLTGPASDALQSFRGAQISEAETRARILPTGLGWLRVRSDPSTNGTEVAKVDVGNEYPVLDQETGWVKILVSEKIQGWVSATYADVVEEGAVQGETTTTNTTPTAPTTPETDGTADTSQ